MNPSIQNISALLVCCGAAQVAWSQIPVPPGLNPGDRYHLVFNSSTFTPAISADIDDYNDFVESAAATAGLGDVAWHALASTPTVDARDNAVVGANSPVYNMQLELVATGFADMWDGSLSATLSWNELGNFNDIDAWTGTLTDGRRAPGLSLGNPSFIAWCGRPTLTDQRWTTFITPALNAGLHVYGLSAELIVQSTATAAGDYNDNGTADAADYTTWRDSVGSTTQLSADGNGNGVVDVSDYHHWVQRYGTVTTFAKSAVSPARNSTVQSVPESMSAVFLLVPLALCRGRSRNHSIRKHRSEELGGSDPTVITECSSSYHCL